ncbi:hypothetical protein HDU85_001041 [Gaertneriomyces sp. JEL0708]|nr:hypothetical protein HDU85_001041 [Gaertneriomyces sp. JEL0708]
MLSCPVYDWEWDSDSDTSETPGDTKWTEVAHPTKHNELPAIVKERRSPASGGRPTPFSAVNWDTDEDATSTISRSTNDIHSFRATSGRGASLWDTDSVADSETATTTTDFENWEINSSVNAAEWGFDVAEPMQGEQLPSLPFLPHDGQQSSIPEADATLHHSTCRACSPHEEIIYCRMCKHRLPRCRFSIVQAGKYSADATTPWWVKTLKMHRGPDGRHQPTCYECTGKPVFEFYCHPCKKLKHRDEFSKAQRNNKYHRCLQCVARYNQPWLDQVVDSDFEDEDMEGDSRAETSQISSHYLEQQFEGLTVEDAREVYMSWTDDESSMYSTDYDD